MKNTAFWAKIPKMRYFVKITAFDENHGFRDFCVRYFVKITAFDENHGFRDFCVSVIFYCL